MDYTPEACDVDFEDFNSAVADDAMVIICGECGAPVIDGTICEACGVPTQSWIDANPDWQDDCPMDGDHESALASVGWGMDEDYGCFGGDEW